MAISEGYKANFETLLRAVGNGDAILFECQDKNTGNTVIAICAVSVDEEGMVSVSPLARMFDGNPFDELLPPAEEEAT